MRKFKDSPLNGNRTFEENVFRCRDLLNILKKEGVVKLCKKDRTEFKKFAVYGDACLDRHVLLYFMITGNNKYLTIERSKLVNCRHLAKIYNKMELDDFFNVIHKSTKKKRSRKVKKIQFGEHLKGDCVESIIGELDFFIQATSVDTAKKKTAIEGLEIIYQMIIELQTAVMEKQKRENFSIKGIIGDSYVVVKKQLGNRETGDLPLFEGDVVKLILIEEENSWYVQKIRDMEGRQCNNTYGYLNPQRCFI